MLDPIAQLTLFRVAQEALASILARGGARHVELVHRDRRRGLSDDSVAMTAQPSDTDLARVDAEHAPSHGARAGGTIEAESVARSGKSHQGLRAAIRSKIGMS